MFSTFDLEFAWIGLGAAVVLTVVLLATDALRSDHALSRWKDPSCLGWLAVVMYLFHIFEEYGIAADGARHAFPDSLCTRLGLGTYPDRAIPTEFYLFVTVCQARARVFTVLIEGASLFRSGIAAHRTDEADAELINSATALLD